MFFLKEYQILSKQPNSSYSLLVPDSGLSYLTMLSVSRLYSIDRIDECGAVGEMRVGRVTEVLIESLAQSQIPHT
jgi:hypothetical protein